MARRQRKKRKQNVVILVFCEGESEQAYVKYLKQQFRDVAVLDAIRKNKLFEEAYQLFLNDPRYRDNLEVIDEVWFFFDVESKDKNKWPERKNIMDKLRKKSKNPNFKIRLLMTKECLEYWLLLHYESYQKDIETDPNKKYVMDRLLKHEPLYAKGDEDVIFRIAQHCDTAMTNARKTLEQLVKEGMPVPENPLDADSLWERNHWLCTQCRTFSNVHEAIQFLEGLRI